MLGPSREAVRGWVCRVEVVAGRRLGLAGGARERFERLGREYRGLCRASEVLRSASILVAADDRCVWRSYAVMLTSYAVHHADDDLAGRSAGEAGAARC